MRLIKCPKCKSFVTTEDNLQQQMFAEVSRLSELARKDKKNAAAYLSEAKTIRKILSQTIHLSAQLDEERSRLANELKVIVHYLLDNHLITQEKLDELNNIARSHAAENQRKASDRMQELYGDFNNIMSNRSKSDPTADRAIRQSQRKKP